MALNFPNAPADGDKHIEEGQTWVWNDANACWSVWDAEIDTAPVEIVEADAPAGWQVWGDVLVQWGVAVPSAGFVVVTFQQPFETPPALSATGAGGAALSVTTTENSVTSVRFNVFDANGTSVDTAFSWVAIGEAPDALKKPKTVQTVGGSELQEYYDPTGRQNWRIVGNTLECWGYGNTPDPITFTKQFKQASGVAVNITPLTLDNQTRFCSIINISATGFTPIGFLNNGSTPSVFQVRWHAIGEWDGVS